jgi:hypothetical protein
MDIDWSYDLTKGILNYLKINDDNKMSKETF